MNNNDGPCGGYSRKECQESKQRTDGLQATDTGYLILFDLGIKGAENDVGIIW